MNEDKELFPALYNGDDDGFIIIAHRGASASHPENTMAAFEAAVQMNAEMIEIDVMMSKDSVPVVFHDGSLNKHTDGKGPLKNLTVDQLMKLDAGSWFDEKFTGERIPTLEEVLEFASGTIALNIEIKTEAVTDELRGGVEEKSLKLVKKYEMENHVLFSSFDYRAIRHLKELNADIPVGLLYNKRLSGNLKPSELIKKYSANAFNCNYFQLTKKRYSNLQEHKIPALIYTVDKKKRMKKLLEKGVRGIFTNKPDVLLDVVTDFRK